MHQRVLCYVLSWWYARNIIGRMEMHQQRERVSTTCHLTTEEFELFRMNFRDSVLSNDTLLANT